MPAVATAGGWEGPAWSGETIAEQENIVAAWGGGRECGRSTRVLDTET